jgi:hypothetical protein
MSAPRSALAESFARDANRDDLDAPEITPAWIAHILVLIMYALLQLHHRRVLAYRRRRARWMELRAGWLQTMAHGRPDLPAGSAQAEAAALRGPFGHAIACLCRRYGIGPGHVDWPELSRAIVTFGGSLKGFRPGNPPSGPLAWESPVFLPGSVPYFGTQPLTPIAALLQREADANARPLALDVLQAEAMQAEAAHASLPPSWLAASWLAASWLSPSGRQVFARAGPCPPTGPPGCPDCHICYA